MRATVNLEPEASLSAAVDRGREPLLRLCSMLIKLVQFLYNMKPEVVKAQRQLVVRFLQKRTDSFFLLIK